MDLAGPFHKNSWHSPIWKDSLSTITMVFVCSGPPISSIGGTKTSNRAGWEYCNDDERAALEILYEITGGSGWTNSGGWLGDGPLGEWYGVTVGCPRPGHRARLERQRTQGTASRYPRPTIPVDRVTGRRQRAGGPVADELEEPGGSGVPLLGYQFVRSSRDAVSGVVGGYSVE